MEMVYDLAILSVFIVVFIYLSGWFSGTETALTNLTESQIAEMKRKKEKNFVYIIELKKNMDRTLITILIGNNIVNIVLSAVAALIADALFKKIGVTIAIGVITFLIIIFGEITPKSNAIMDSKKVARKNAKIVFYLMRSLGPIISIFLFLSRKIIELTVGTKKEDNLLVSDESIKSLASLGESEGLIKGIERDIIHKVFLFGDSKIKELMVPMSRVFSIEKNYTIQEARAIVTERGYTRIPIMSKGEKVIGVLHSKDLIGKEKGRIKSLMRTPLIVSEKNDVTDVFHTMKEKRVHMAIVKDDSGKHIGIVTLEDTLEQLVGDIYDEHAEVKHKDRGGLDK
jgi:putative hemolysin